MRRSSCATCAAWAETQERRRPGSRLPSRPPRQDDGPSRSCPAPTPPRVEYMKRVVCPVPEEGRLVEIDKNYWKAQFEKLESDVRGAGGVAPEAAWDALPGNVLGRVAPILHLPMPVAASMTSLHGSSSATRMYWVEIPLPPELADMKVEPEANVLANWQFAEIPDDDPNFRMFKRGSDVGKVDLPAWYKLAKKAAEQAAEKVTSTTDAKISAAKTSAHLLAKEIHRVEDTLLERIEETAEKNEVAEEEEEEEDEESEEAYEEMKLKFYGYETEEQIKETQEIENKKGIEHTVHRAEMKRRERKINKLRKRKKPLLPGEVEEELEQSNALDRLGVDLEVHPASTCPRDKGSFSWPHMPRNPYFKFLKKSTTKAATWRERERPESSGEAMDTSVLLHPMYNLLEKANHITQTITMEFLDWMEGLGGVQQTDLTNEILQQLFDVTFDLPAAHALCVRVRELPVVTKEVADAAFAPQAETHEGLRLRLKADVEVEALEKHVVAFGRALGTCCPQRFVPPRNDVRRTWIDCGRLPEELASGKQVFQGITQLQSVQKFCEFLERNPRLAVPPYLRSVGMVGLTGLAAARVRRRGGFLPWGKRPNKKKKPPRQGSILRRGSLGLIPDPPEFHAVDSQVVRGHSSGLAFKFDRSPLL